jgi:hypothetical protein
MSKFHVTYVGWVKHPYDEGEHMLSQLASSESYEISEDEQFYMDFISEISEPRESGMGYELCSWKAHKFITEHKEKFTSFMYFDSPDESPEDFFAQLEESNLVEALVENMESDGALPDCYSRYDMLSEYAPEALNEGRSYVGLITEDEYSAMYGQPEKIEEVTETVEAFGSSITLTANLIDGVLDPTSIKVVAPEDEEKEAA